ncbi:MAG: GNAT family N-acetyltransferase [Gammaproteobacteria bacterium]|nr:GNAT family N-acetyltransferase [Gammaproteobacteria bacterium]
MLTLRDYRDDDAARLVQLANNPKVSRFLIDTFPYPYAIEDAEWWVREGCLGLGMITKVIDVDGTFVGSVGLTLQTGWRSHTAEVGYWLGEAYWGQGLATLALQRMCEQAFAEMRLRKVYAPVLAPNIASMRVLQKCGFTKVGVMVDDVVKQGRFFDVHHFERCHPSVDRHSTATDAEY